ncbi:hypothetical protein P153DRAFT_284361 [Dothidotthia symphoricarpi CBS 119687]|uniref:PAC domain-containing protein n=1 Tax=Dothidotthia symphoricarpi CBS 119687 TaxID=1392245 RepID=A0A6A6ANT1_9PLEO|nr:uncharacterized protein P153DRAFT_284361 [Dothidotthia symphoricarpi CBS 119687]KAF2132151.1 hypothetical protein P153DRAFT_284361 [Dothidotthia symphoricarpi CBS 119687]
MAGEIGSAYGAHEPLALDFATMHDGYKAHGQNPPLTPPGTETGLYQNYSEHWLEQEDDDSAPAPPDVNRRNMLQVASQTSSHHTSSMGKRLNFLSRRKSIDMPADLDVPKLRPRSASRTSNAPITVQRPPTRSSSIEPPMSRSRAGSVVSGYSPGSDYSSTHSIATNALPPLQKLRLLDEDDRLSPLLEDDPKSFDLIAPPDEQNGRNEYSLETRSEQLFSKQHLEAIFKDTPSLLRFSSFLGVARPQSVPVLIYFLDALKALRAIKYANAVAEALEPIQGLEFSTSLPRPTVNTVLEEKANQAFDKMVRDDLPAFITHVFIQVASVSISKRVTGNLPPALQQASEGLAEVFCLTDPSRRDNPIIFASEEFHRTTQYGVGYAIGRNCRFLQGPKTNRTCVTRFKEMIEGGKEHNEVILNYRRDGSPFLNLLMMAPLLDSRGQLRYFIGAQIDVSGLAKDCADLEAFQHMLDQQDGYEPKDEPKDEFQDLAEMFNHTELDTVRTFGGNMHRDYVDEQDNASMRGGHRPRLLIQDQSTLDVNMAEKPAPKPEGRLSGPYKHYILVRPAPSLRILFCSPSLRVPGILQSPFLDRIGGGNSVRTSLSRALSDGTRGVTAKIRWLPHAVQDLENSSEEGRPRWIHCTPLLGNGGAVGVWMIVIVDDEKYPSQERRFRQAPPIPNDLRSRRQDTHPYRHNGMLDDNSDMFTPRSSSLTSGHAAAARHGTQDRGRQDLSPRGMAPRSSFNEQRTMRSAASSVDSFRI